MNLRESFKNQLPRLGRAGRALPRIALLALAVAAVYAVVSHPPLYTVPRGEVAVRTNLFSGQPTRFDEGRILALPGVHEVRSLPMRDQVFHATQLARADGAGALQSLEGLSLGMDLTLAWRVDAKQLPGIATRLPENIERDLIGPALQASVYPVVSQHTVREIFSSKRGEIEQAIAGSLKTRLPEQGIELRGLQIGHVDLPADYRRGMDGLLAEGLATEKMQYTLELKAKQVKQTELEAQAQKSRREIDAEAAEREQVIAARAQEEAMKHILPLKQKQIEQRSLEAEAANAQRIKLAEGNAKARQIEATAEAKARETLADAEAYRVAEISKVDAQRMAREGALLTQHPLLVQKALADKLADKVQVIIAPPSASGAFIGSGLLGGAQAQQQDTQAAQQQQQQGAE
ncbi:SPFH domain-containing protein [Paucibacter sp. R3-3]|uniref:SPFH domain-containing protein n=1 Tax=Roseateles agri TaxID=3098619 RepID=A0ABU5DS04_9BURK|nr:SPFH domain-containing protein [Paucibacter sp. R3-3]MDY0748019.1 SPFH domain-containing protein [Paucibacter sp. R3-3]